MTNVTARLKAKGKNFETLVDLDKALALKKSGKDGGIFIQEIMATDQIFYDIKKGLRVSSSDLKQAFGTDNINDVVKKIIKQGEILLPQDYKNEERQKRIKQVIDFLVRSAVDPKTGQPHTSNRIQGAIEQSGVNIEDKPIEQQMSRIIEKVKTILPLKIETKKLSIKVPATHTGKVYGLLQEYKEKEEWLSDGSLYCIINIPNAMQMEFYDKLNNITHGSAIVEETKSRT